jgi:hypothetical protein
VRRELFQEILRGLKKTLDDIDKSLRNLDRILSPLVTAASAKNFVKRRIIAPITALVKSSTIIEEQNHIKSLCDGLSLLLQALSQ